VDEESAHATGRRLFTKETFGGNGRTCRTCHSAETGTVSPQDARRRFRKDSSDPLFEFDGSDDGADHGVSRMLTDATVLIEIPLPPNVSLADDPTARSVILRRGIPSTLNTPALDPVLMLDGREPNLPTQAGNAIRRHAQAPGPVSESDLMEIAGVEITAQFFSSPALRRFGRGGPAPVLPEGRTASEKRGRLFFIDAPATGDFKRGACAVCHSGPMLNQTNQFLPLPVPAGTRFQTVNVSEFNAAENPVRPFIFRNPDGTEIRVLSPDSGRALITGSIDGDPNADGAPFFTSLNAFKIPTLWGVRNTAPYFHDNSAKTLEDVAAHYARSFLTIPAQIKLTKQDQQDIVAYLKLLD
jgi:cytochrome c peroxidase